GGGGGGAAGGTGGGGWGFGPHVSCWGGPPRWKSRMHAFALRFGVGEADSSDGRPRPNRLSPPTRSQSRRVRPSQRRGPRWGMENMAPPLGHRQNLLYLHGRARASREMATPLSRIEWTNAAAPVGRTGAAVSSGGDAYFPPSAFCFRAAASATSASCRLMSPSPSVSSRRNSSN